MGAEGQAERDEHALGSTGFLPGALEGGATEGADAVPGNKNKTYTFLENNHFLIHFIGKNLFFNFPESLHFEFCEGPSKH